MKVYDTLKSINLTYHNSGSSWRGILRGATEEIELTFNGLFNLRATNGDLYYCNHLKDTAFFWTDRRAMRRFFFNQFLFRHLPDEGRTPLALCKQAMAFAHGQLKTLGETSHEFFADFGDNYMPEMHGVGRVTAERPDNDMKDNILAHAYRDRTGEEKN